MRGFGCSGGKHSKYCPIWLKIKIYTPHYIHILSVELVLHRRNGGGFVKKYGFFNNTPIYGQLHCFSSQINMPDIWYKSGCLLDAQTAAGTPP